MNGNHADNKGEIVKKILLVTAAVLLATPSAMTEPLISGSELGWGNKMSAKQRRQTGFDDVLTALKNTHKPDAPTKGVPGYAFNLLTIRHGVHGHDGGNGASGNSGGSTAGGTTTVDGPRLHKAPPFSMNQIRSEPFGVFATLQECDAARAQKIADLDAKGDRFFHQRW